MEKSLGRYAIDCGAALVLGPPWRTNAAPMRRAYFKRPLDATFTPMPRLRRFIFFTRARFSALFRMRGWKVLETRTPRTRTR